MERLFTRIQQSRVPSREPQPSRMYNPANPPDLPGKARNQYTSRSMSHPPDLPQLLNKNNAPTGPQTTPNTSLAMLPPRSQTTRALQAGRCDPPEGSGWYPQFTRRSTQPSVAHDHHCQQEMKANPGGDWAPQQPQHRRARRALKDITNWENCFNDRCNDK